MLPFSRGNKNNSNNQIKHQIYHHKSSSTCSSPSSHHNQTPNRSPSSSSPRKSMEEVWEDINLPCLQDHPSTTVTNTTSHSAFPGMILQDFFDRPFNKHLPTQPSSATATDDNHNNDFSKSLGPPPATLLSLNSNTYDFQFLRKSNPNPQLHTHVSVGTIPCFDAVGSSSIFPSLCKKRPQENQENSTDRKHKRMIKNRESAARSRARKQAYTQELELEIANLLEENARLRSQQEKFVAVPAYLPKKNTLSRTLTAPF